VGTVATVFVSGVLLAAASAPESPAVASASPVVREPAAPPAPSPAPSLAPSPAPSLDGDPELASAPEEEPTPAPLPKAPASPSAKWWCTASASVRVCGFAGACNYQMVFGNGGGTDRFLASQQAKNACEASARSKGAFATCIVQCSPG
jgi:hypothetical protein